VGYWRTRDGRVLKITTMEDSHLRNAIELFERSVWGRHAKILELRNELARRDRERSMEQRNNLTVLLERVVRGNSAGDDSQESVDDAMRRCMEGDIRDIRELLVALTHLVLTHLDAP
jgi:hypothetical protein